jgi:hypothetical protein
LEYLRKIFKKNKNWMKYQLIFSNMMVVRELVEFGFIKSIESFQENNMIYIENENNYVYIEPMTLQKSKLDANVILKEMIGYFNGKVAGYFS